MKIMKSGRCLAGWSKFVGFSEKTSKPFEKMKISNPAFCIINLCFLLFMGTDENNFCDMAAPGQVQEAELLDYLNITDERLRNGAVRLSPEVLALIEELYQFEQASVHKPYQPLKVARKKQQLGGKHKVMDFHLPGLSAMELQDDLFILGQGDVVLDGDVFGKAIEDGNRPGQNLVIKTEGKIIIRGNIYLSKGGDAPFSKPCLATSKNHSVFQVLLAGGMGVNSSLNLVKKQHEIEMPEVLAGGQGGNILLRAKEILIEGRLYPGDGGNAVNGGKSGAGGSIILLSGHTFYKRDLKAGDGGSGGQGGRGGDALSLRTPGEDGADNSGSGNIIGGHGGDGTNASVGGDGGNASSTDGNATGGNGGTGGNGIDSFFPPIPGSGGGGGGKGGYAYGGNPATGPGGVGTGGNGGNAGPPGASPGGASQGAIGGDGGGGGNGYGGDGSPGGIGTGGVGGAEGAGSEPNGNSGRPGINGLGFNGSTILPVTLVYFRAAEQKGLVALQWNTASESSNSGFRIEHSATGMVWESVGFVKGAGTTQEQQSYSFTHSGFSDGINYYRLKQIDFDGAFEYSGIVSIKMKLENKGFIVSPNPASGNGSLLLKFLSPAQGSLIIYNQLGEKVYQVPIRKEQKGLEIVLPNLPSGIYTLELKAGRERFVEQVVVE